MKHMFLNKHSLMAGLSVIVLGFCSCLNDGDESIILENAVGQLVADIPSDNNATDNPSVSNPTTTLPNATCSVEKNSDGIYVASINMTGVWNDEAEEWLKLYGTNYNTQNVWVSVDGTPKGIDVYNTIDGEASRTISADLVFLVDHSGSMSEEADGLANQVIAWSQKLAQSGLDIRFGCVGYGASYYSNTSIGGALNLTTATELKTYFDRGSGVRRTVGFYGSDADALKNKAVSGNYNNGSGHNECGMVALRFADDNFAFRNESNRIYVNFTDEPNQPGGKQDWSVEALKTNIWNTSKGTIHTVWSSAYNYTWSTLYEENPKLMSEYTGGTSMDVNASFTSVTLEDLPVTGAMQNSYIIRFTNINEYMDGKPHTIKVTVVSNDGKVQAEKEFNVIFGVAE